MWLRVSTSERPEEVFIGGEEGFSFFFEPIKNASSHQSLSRRVSSAVQARHGLAARGDAQLTDFQGLGDCQQAPGTLRKHPDAKAGIYSNACKP
jgi:hypothetical protein